MRRNSHFKNSTAVGDYYYSLGTISTFIVRKCFQIYPIIFKYRILGRTSRVTLVTSPITDLKYLIAIVYLDLVQGILLNKVH